MAEKTVRINVRKLFGFLVVVTVLWALFCHYNTSHYTYSYYNRNRISNQFTENRNPPSFVNENNLSIAERINLIKSNSMRFVWFSPPWSVNYINPLLDLKPPGFIFSPHHQGFGNVLFSYACNYALSRKFKVPLYYDCGSSCIYLDQFNVPEAAGRLLNINKSMIQEPLITWEDPDLYYGRIDFQNISKTKLMWHEQYCQGEIYFQEYKEEIRKMFTFKVDPAKKNPWIRDWVPILRNNPSHHSVCVHIRRGDMMWWSEYLGYLTPMRFFRMAMARVDALLGERDLKPVKFFIFTDSLDVVKANLFNITLDQEGTAGDVERRDEELKKLLAVVNPEKDVYYIGDSLERQTNSGPLAMAQFHLLTKCDHLIISFSTFSWWAAYLNEHREKDMIVIRPTVNPTWFNLFKDNKDLREYQVGAMKNLFLKEWIRIDPYFGKGVG